MYVMDYTVLFCTVLYVCRGRGGDGAAAEPVQVPGLLLPHVQGVPVHRETRSGNPYSLYLYVYLGLIYLGA